MSDDYWARKLGVATNPAPAPYTPTRDLFPAYNPQPFRQETVPGQMAAQAQEQEYVPTVRMKQGDTCPGCNSDKYFSPSPSYMPVCGDCGYNPRFEQQAYGAPSLKGDPSVPVEAARQLRDQPFSLKGAVAVLNAGGGEHIR